MCCLLILPYYLVTNTFRHPVGTYCQPDSEACITACRVQKRLYLFVIYIGRRGCYLNAVGEKPHL